MLTAGTTASVSIDTDIVIIDLYLNKRQKELQSSIAQQRRKAEQLNARIPVF